MLNRRMLISLITMGILISIFTASTLATWSTTQSVNNNKFEAGKLGIKFTNHYLKKPTYIPMIATNTKPGDSFIGLSNNGLYIYNTGSITGMLKAKVVQSKSDDGILAKYLVITATDSPIPGGKTFILWNKGPVASQSLGSLDAYPALGKTYYFVYSFPDYGLTQNDAKGKSFNFDVKFELEQD